MLFFLFQRNSHRCDRWKKEIKEVNNLSCENSISCSAAFSTDIFIHLRRITNCSLRYFEGIIIKILLQVATVWNTYQNCIRNACRIILIYCFNVFHLCFQLTSSEISIYNLYYNSKYFRTLKVKNHLYLCTVGAFFRLIFRWRLIQHKYQKFSPLHIYFIRVSDKLWSIYNRKNTSVRSLS